MISPWLTVADSRKSLRIQLLSSLNLPKFRALLLEIAKENGLKSCIRVRAGGHNNTEINPVFRGMP
jgi:hypothetical protein